MGFELSLTAIYIYIYLKQQTTIPTGLLRIRVKTTELETWKMENLEKDERFEFKGNQKVLGFLVAVELEDRQKRERWVKVFWIQRLSFLSLFYFIWFKPHELFDLFKA